MWQYKLEIFFLEKSSNSVNLIVGGWIIILLAFWTVNLVSRRASRRKFLWKLVSVKENIIDEFMIIKHARNPKLGRERERSNWIMCKKINSRRRERPGKRKTWSINIPQANHVRKKINSILIFFRWITMMMCVLDINIFLKSGLSGGWREKEKSSVGKCVFHLPS